MLLRAGFMFGVFGSFRAGFCGCLGFLVLVLAFWFFAKLSVHG